MKQWLVVGVEGSIPWPTRDIEVEFCGRAFWLRAQQEKTSATVEIQFAPPETRAGALGLVRRFMSALSWAEGYSLRETLVLSGGRRVGVGCGHEAQVRNSHFKADYLPAPVDPRAQLALALYREALGVNTVAYQFLGFFKILNVLHATGNAQIAWINSVLPRLTNHRAVERLAQLLPVHADVGQYLYASGRCAVAHAFSTPVVDPDDPVDHARLTADLPIARALAEWAIEYEFGVKSRATVWGEHLSELDGFRSLFQEPLVAALKARQSIDAKSLPALPPLSLRVRDQNKFNSLEGMQPSVLEVRDGRLVVLCESNAAGLRAVISLNFADERLEFDPETDVRATDDGSVQVVEAALDHLRLLRCLFCNGQLEVWRADTQALMGRTRAYVAVNIDLRGTLENLEALEGQYRAELARRRERDA